jgi:hypothetical protein
MVTFLWKICNTLQQCFAILFEKYPKNLHEINIYCACQIKLPHIILGFNYLLIEMILAALKRACFMNSSSG